MTTPPTFSVGQTLTSAAMNSVGLWLVKSQTVGTGVSSVTVTGAFSADYDAYKIVLSNVDGSASTSALVLQLVDSGGTASTTNYSQTGIYLTYSSATVNGINQSNWDMGLSATNVGLSFDLYNPFLAVSTYYQSSTADDTYYRSYGGKHTNAISYPAFRLAPNSGTITGGTIRVYGYRN